MEKDFFRLTFVTNKGRFPLQNYLDLVRECVKAGITSVQLREKELSDDELFFFGKTLKELLDSTQIPLIVNDRPDLCLQLNASGVHLGQKDGNPLKARQILGPDKIVGLSVNTLTQVVHANSLPLNYVGLGAIFPTKNKPNVETVWGLEGLRNAFKLASHPIIAIGGINENNARSVINSGAQGVAAIGFFHDAVDPYLNTRNLINLMNEVKNQ